MAVALKHLSEPPTPISQLRPDVHPTLESVVMAALAKDPAQRWQTAEDFAAALSAARDHIASGAPVARDTAEFAPVAVVRPVATNGDSAAAAPSRRSEAPLAVVHDRAPGPAAARAAGFLAAERRARRRQEGGAAGGGPAARSRPGEQLERAGFEVATERVRSPADLDEVVDQDPDAGEQADEGSTVTLEVSNGPGNVLRALGGEPAAGARPSRSSRRRASKVTVNREPSDDVAEGIAIRTLPRAGHPVERGSRVTRRELGPGAGGGAGRGRAVPRLGRGHASAARASR